jgi:hypothetical protein
MSCLSSKLYDISVKAKRDRDIFVQNSTLFRDLYLKDITKEMEKCAESSVFTFRICFYSDKYYGVNQDGENVIPSIQGEKNNFLLPFKYEEPFLKWSESENFKVIRGGGDYLRSHIVSWNKEVV